MAGKNWLPVALVAGVCLGSLALDRTAAAATLDPTPATVIAGQSITLTLNDTVSGVGGVDIFLTFPTSLFTLTSVTNGTLLATWDSPIYDPTTGLIRIFEKIDGTSDDADGTGSILNLTFAATVTDPTGIATVTLQPLFDPSSAVGLAAASIGEYEFATIQKPVNITAAAVTPPTKVPEPGTIALLLAPMLAGAGLTRRNRC